MINENEKDKIMHDLKGRVSSITSIIDLVQDALDKKKNDPRFIQLVDEAIEELGGTWKDIKDILKKY